jgi:iron complex outermembrane receptor protein
MHVKAGSSQKSNSLRRAFTAGALLTFGIRAALAAADDDLSHLDLVTLMEMDVTLVTAQKRTENVNSVPISMHVVKADRINGLKLDSSADLQIVAPGLTTTSNAFWMLPFIRGVGTDINSSGIEPSVAIYVDGIYQAARVQTLVDLTGVEQIEILKGPQGTLYGRNATGGAINITTRGPSKEHSGFIDVSTGNLDLRDASAFVSGPLSAGVRASFSAHSRTRDGYYRNLLTGDNVGGEDFYSLNGRLQFDLSEALQAEILLKYLQRDDASNYATELSHNSIPSLLGAQVTTIPYTTAANLNSDPYSHKDSTAAVKLNWELSTWQVRSTSAYSAQRQHILVDFDASSATLTHMRAYEGSHAFTQEVQLMPLREAERLNWLLGVFYIDSSDGFTPILVDATVPILGEITQSISGTVKTRAYAVFGEATLAVTDAWSVTSGLRYSSEQKRLVDSTAGLQGTPLTAFPDHAHEWDDVSYRLVAKYATGASTLYAKTETGFKSGVYNNSNPLNPGPIDPEQITAYELGWKTAVPNLPVRIATAAFFNDYRDLQIQVVDVRDGVTTLVQGKQARTYGMDLNAEIKANSHWTIGAGVAWLEAEYRDFIASGILVPSATGGNSPAQLNLGGNRLARSPQLAANLTASFEYPLASGTLLAATNYYRSSRLYFDPANAYSQKPFGIASTRVSYRSIAGWSVAAWVRNLTDEVYLSSVIPGQLGAFGQYSEPRTYGLSAGYSFGH